MLSGEPTAPQCKHHTPRPAACSERDAGAGSCPPSGCCVRKNGPHAALGLKKIHHCAAHAGTPWPRYRAKPLRSRASTTPKALPRVQRGSPCLQLPALCTTPLHVHRTSPDPLQLWTPPPLHTTTTRGCRLRSRPPPPPPPAQLAVAACGRRPRACTGSTCTSTWWCDGRRGAYGAPGWCCMCTLEARACNQWAGHRGSGLHLL